MGEKSSGPPGIQWSDGSDRVVDARRSKLSRSSRMALTSAATVNERGTDEDQTKVWDEMSVLSVLAAFWTSAWTRVLE